MSVTAQRLDDWWSTGIECKELLKVSEVKDDAGAVISQTFYRRTHMVLQLSRKVVGVTSFQEDTGSSRSAFDYRTGPDTRVAYASTAKKFRCTGHRLTPLTNEVGEQDEIQVWEFYSKWEELADNAFTA